MSNLYKGRTSESEGGGNNYSVLNVPGFKSYKVKEGKGLKNKVNIIKYKVGSKNHPLVAKGDLKIGSEDFMFTWFEHRVGPNNTRVVCPKRTFGKRCPCCEVKEELKEQGLAWDDPKVKLWNPSERSAFYVQDVSGDVAEEVELFQVSAFLFTKHLLAAAGDDEQAADYDDQFVEFAEPAKIGRVVTFKAKTEGEGKKKMTKFDSFGFEQRDQKFKVPAADMELPSLDKCLKIHSYDEIKALMEGEDLEDKEEAKEEKPTPKPKPAPKPAPVDDDDVKVDFGDGNSCPNGYKWGSADMYPKCQKCDPKCYDACCKA